MKSSASIVLLLKREKQKTVTIHNHSAWSARLPGRLYETVLSAEHLQKSGGFIMKKVSVILTAAAITTVLGATAALAAGNGSRNAYGSGDQAAPAYSCTYCGDSSHCFTDADGDGICDHFHTHTARTDPAGQAKNTGTGNGYRHHSEDTVCPGGQHHTESGCPSGSGHGNQYHH